MLLPLVLYQGTAFSRAGAQCKIGGFSRWYLALGAKALSINGLLGATAEAVP
jgi:hypothetical protein